MSQPTHKPFILDDESPLGYFSKLTEFIYDPQYARYLRRIAHRYQRELIPPEIDLMPFFVDGLIFETYIQGKTPLDHFIDSYRSQMQPAQLRIYQNFKHDLFSCYEILEHPGKDQVRLKDLLDGSEVLIRDAEARRQLFVGLHVMARLLPFEDYFVPTGACALLSHRSPQEILEIARLLKLPPLMINEPG